MKRLLLYALLFATGTVLFNCSSMLDDIPVYGEQSNQNFYNTDDQIKEALTGTYLQLRTTWNEYALNHYFVGDCSTDDALKGGADDGDRREVLDLSNFIIDPTNGEVGRRWEILYRLVQRANEVIYYAPNAAGNKELIKRYTDEAKALRAFGYYSLVTTFGGVPLISEPITPANALVTTRATADEVYALIIADLTDALELPEKGEYSDADAYRVTKGFAQAMLAKTYMFRRDFVNAEKVLRDLVGSNKYDLLPDYGFNWTKQHENSIESIFEMPNKLFARNIATGTNVPHFFTSRGPVPGYQGYGFHVPTKDLFDAFETDDPRITYIFTQTGDRYVGDEKEQDNSTSATGFNDYKMTVPAIDKIGFDVWMIEYNIRMLRYSDILLLYAEVLNENGKSSEALPQLNKVRQRARTTKPLDPRRDRQVFVPATTAASLPDITTTDQEQLRQAIWHERRCELGMEGWRRDDLMRQQRFGKVMRAYAAKYNTTKGKNFDDSRDNLLPIPQGEIDRTNGALKPNPGW